MTAHDEFMAWHREQYAETMAWHREQMDAQRTFYQGLLRSNHAFYGTLLLITSVIAGYFFGHFVVVQGLQQASQITVPSR